MSRLSRVFCVFVGTDSPSYGKMSGMLLTSITRMPTGQTDKHIFFEVKRNYRTSLKSEFTRNMPEIRWMDAATTSPVFLPSEHVS